MKNACDFRVEGLAAEQMRMLERVRQGFHCSEVLLFAGLDARGENNPDLIKAVSALAGGVGFSGELCGALTGGACLLGLYAGRGSENENADERLSIMVTELIDWFSEKFGQSYGGIRCREIIGDDSRKPPERCPQIVSGVLKKVKLLLGEHDLAWENKSGAREQRGDTSPESFMPSVGGSRAACPCAGGTR
jgi:C_GCAxxG_C_C family probable redox protein